ncbi:MAG: Spy/CpxP family protein refolding chaperone [Chlorobi bacterium]|nr:Spy/CpxP family protein refolding chaperone [Chlorobiota bacterium]
MKTKKLTLVVAILFFITGSTFAQQGNMANNKKGMNKQNKFMNIPDLTDAQKTQIKEMRTANMKEITPLRNQLREKQAHLQTISTGDNVNKQEVDKTLEEISDIKLQIAKKRESFRQDVRSILTDEQKVYFDANYNKMNKKRPKNKLPRK